jgi:tetratricopeptide (TPR) repeat protein
MAAAQDFNYKVALASGLRELQAGRLRQAEQQFEYLCAKFPASPGGYRGIAKVRMEQADRPGALVALRDGAAKLAKAKEHAGVVSLLTEALQLDPLDLAAHRRLAAAHALAGEMDAAADEYTRYAHAVSATDPAGAQRETRYGVDSLGALPGLLALATEIGLDLQSPPPPRTFGPAAPAGAAAPELATGAIPGIPRRPRGETAAAVDPRLGMLDELDGRESAPETEPGSELTQDWERAAQAVEVAPQAGVAPRKERVPEPELDRTEDPLQADERAAEYIAKGDPRAAQAALIAARHFIADGRTNAASDLLLQLIASGLADHQAQRLLVDVVNTIGKRDVARAKIALLAEALRLDGQAELAVEVERLSQAV